MKQSHRLLLGGRAYDCRAEETVLDALLRQKVDISYSCRSQQCMSCMMRCLNGSPPAASQVNMKPMLVMQNNFLACGCYPASDMEIALPTESISHQVAAEVVALNRLSPKVMEIVMQCETPLDYRAGQTVLMMNSAHFGKRIPIVSPSSVKSNGCYEVHVGIIAGGFFSEWVHDQLQPGEKITLSGVNGELFYLSGNPMKSMMLAGWNGSLGALMAIVQDAFELDHTGLIYLFHGVTHTDYLYWTEEIAEIAGYYPNFRFIPCVEHGDVPDGCFNGTVADAVKAYLPRLNGWSVYVCGERDRVLQLQNLAYLSGAATKEIYREVTEI
ncbi:MAG: 2Fe-2S iron-sulfur cluster binding domain-containing protein [Gammaproteobacteria bacterium]